eukprot:Hpha_TRINITY_DN30162_c0_g1::TRINITY_DN30162_c0_g1_i1::g.110720::m.110720
MWSCLQGLRELCSFPHLKQSGPPPLDWLEGVDTTASRRFVAGDPAALEHLREEGYVVIKDIADEKERAVAEDLLWDYLSGFGMKKGTPDTWKCRHFPGNPANGVIVRGGFGQSDFLWYLRSLPSVLRLFSWLWGTDDLLTSLDGGCVFRPWEGLDPMWRTTGAWYHIDQGTGRTGFQGIQGVLSLTRADRDVGGLIVIPRSHTRHDSFIRMPDANRCGILGVWDDEWVKQAGRKLVCMEAGDMALFDSRVVHCNAPGNGGSRKRTELLRMAGFVAMLPRDRVPLEIIKERHRAAALGLTLSCWADEVLPQSGSFTVEGRGKELSDLTPVQQRLLG